MEHTAIKKEITRLFKYANVTAVSYVALILGTAFLTDICQIHPSLSYATTLTLVYVGLYFASSQYVFRVGKDAHNFYKFVLVIVMFFCFHNFLFNFFLRYFDIHYITAIILNLFFLGPLRYVIYKKWVFKKTT